MPLTETQENFATQLNDIYSKYNVSETMKETAIKVHLSMKPEVIREDNALMTLAFITLSKTQCKKEGTYGRSFCKRGELDIFFNTARKFDRIENMMINGARDEVGEGTIDTVGDMANYGMLWLTYYIRENPEAFESWAAEYGN